LVVPPKKPAQSPFALYVKDNLTGKSMPASEMGGELRRIASRWQSLNDAEKKTYADRASRDYAKWQSEYAKFTSSLTPEQRLAENKYRSYRNKHFKSPRRHKMPTLRDPSLPKLPMNAYMLFCVDYRKSAAPSMGMLEVSKEAGARWRSMSTADKSMYVNMAANESAAYKRAKGE